MKHLLFFLLGCCLTADLAAQNLLNDARAINEYFNPVSSASAGRVSIRTGVKLDVELFRSYVPGGDGLSPDELSDMLETAFENNPFMRVQFTSQSQVEMLKKIPGQSSQVLQPSGFSVAGFADGLARFLVKRTKQELSQAFFDQFKYKVAHDKYLQHFCPATGQHLQMIDQDVYQFKDYLASLRESFIMDMTALPGHTEDFIRDPALCTDCAAKQEGKVMIDMLHMAQQLVNGEAPIDMVNYLAGSSSAIQTASQQEPVLYNMAGGLRFLNLVSESLRNPETKENLMPWFKGSEVREMLKDPKLLRIYLGLLWQKAEGISFLGASPGQVTQLREILTKVSTNVAMIEAWRNALQSLGEKAHGLQLSVKANATSTASNSDDFFRYSESLTNLMEGINEVGGMVLDRPKGSDIIPQDYIFYMRQCNSLYYNVRQRNYTGAISNVIFCLTKIGKDKAGIAAMLKYANFVASIAEANSPEEVENAIDLFALPPGSSRMKKQPGRFAVAVNAYTGLSGGGEFLDGEKSAKPYGAITAPVGLSLSWGLGKVDSTAANGVKVHDYGSLGFFVPLIDVGAVTAFRFKDSTAENLPELSWGNILSPGLYVVYDFPGKWPIAFGFGGQAGPGLRQVTVSNNEIDKGAVHFGAFLTVDIPITYLHLGKGKGDKEKKPVKL